MKSLRYLYVFGVLMNLVLRVCHLLQVLANDSFCCRLGFETQLKESPDADFGAGGFLRA